MDKEKLKSYNDKVYNSDFQEHMIRIQADIARQLTIQNELRQSAQTVEEAKVECLEKIAGNLLRLVQNKGA